MKEILIRLRTENRYTQDQIARMLGISRQSYIKYEAGDVEPTVEMVRKLSRFYAVPYEVLIDGIPEKKAVYPTEDKTGLLAAEASPVYGNTQPAFSADYFAEQLNYLSGVIASMQKSLMLAGIGNSADNTANAPISEVRQTSSSKPLDKAAFFKEFGNITIDGSYIDEWRQISLI